MTAPIVTAVVVAYNRSELLAECLAALRAQTRPVDRVLVVDNASTDDTAAMLARDFAGVTVVSLARNTGGAGGFAVGIERAVQTTGADWVWLLDDDTVPDPDALAALLAAGTCLGGPQLLASRVLWTDGRDHPMNTPRVRPFATPPEIAAAARCASYPIRSASFVSVLIRADVIRRRGLPVADYFLWNDDFEYTTRILRRARGYLVRASTVRHRTKTFGATDADPGARFYWEVRNKLWLLTRSGSLGPAERVLYGGSTVLRWGRTLARSRQRGVLLDGLRRGLVDGLRPPRTNAEVLADLEPELVAGQAELGAPEAAIQLADLTAADELAPLDRAPLDGVAQPAREPFSVLLPVWAEDDPDHFCRAARSVTVEQELRPDELVVVQDGPVPPPLAAAIAQTARTCAVPFTHHVLTRNAGLARALSAGLAACRHDVVARMDADDIALASRFARQLPLIEAGADLVGSGMYEFHGEGQIVAKRTPPTSAGAIATYATFHDPFNHPTVVYRRSVVAAAGGYQELPLMEDYWLFARMIQSGAAVANLADPLVLYRVDEGAYRRRGGWRLFTSELRLQRELLSAGFLNPAQFARNVVIRGGYRFVPVGLRRALYRRRFASPADVGRVLRPDAPVDA